MRGEILGEAFSDELARGRAADLVDGHHRPSAPDPVLSERGRRGRQRDREGRDDGET
jgi:hypothetical protein